MLNPAFTLTIYYVVFQLILGERHSAVRHLLAVGIVGVELVFNALGWRNWVGYGQRFDCEKGVVSARGVAAWPQSAPRCSTFCCRCIVMAHRVGDVPPCA